MRPTSIASSASESTCVASGGSTIASPGPITAFANLPKRSGSAGGPPAGPAAWGGVVESGADDLQRWLLPGAGSRFPRYGNPLRSDGATRPAVHALPRADPARRGAGVRGRLDVRLARALAGVDPAADARRRAHLPDEARPFRHESR